jgi:hypothetical protein
MRIELLLQPSSDEGSDFRFTAVSKLAIADPGFSGFG